MEIHMLSNRPVRRLLAALFLGVLLFPQWARAEEAAEPQGQATPAQPASPVPAVPVLSPEDAALLAIQEEGRQQVAAVVQQMAGLKPGPELLELQRRVELIKRDTTVQFLTARAQFSRARGDETAALEAEKVIDLILHPAPPPAETAPQPREKFADPKGGSR
jgi:hypothetical protein